MSHHSQDPESARHMRKTFESLLQKPDTSPFGATGKYPKGQLNSSDEGEISFGIAHANGKVLLQFGKPVAWMGLDPEQAIAIAEVLTLHAKAIQKGQDEAK